MTSDGSSSHKFHKTTDEGRLSLDSVKVSTKGSHMTIVGRRLY